LPERRDTNTSATRPVLKTSIVRNDPENRSSEEDWLAAEEPLQILLEQEQTPAFPLAVTMRTPGHDEELATGYLFTEGVIRNKKDIKSIYRPENEPDADNTVILRLATNISLDRDQLQKHSYTNSSCGVCGKTAIQALAMHHEPELDKELPAFNEQLLYELPEKLRTVQEQFAKTGGTHCTALVNNDGDMILAREDIGRHNAMDKLIGHILLNDMSPQKDCLLLVSGRIGFELVQKALMADFAMIAAIGAPSSLAVELANRYQMTLIGFLKEERFNIYGDTQRLISPTT
jgi:FdhD protein